MTVNKQIIACIVYLYLSMKHNINVDINKSSYKVVYSLLIPQTLFQKLMFSSDLLVFVKGVIYNYKENTKR